MQGKVGLKSNDAPCTKSCLRSFFDSGMTQKQRAGLEYSLDAFHKRVGIGCVFVDGIYAAACNHREAQCSSPLGFSVIKVKMRNLFFPFLCEACGVPAQDIVTVWAIACDMASALFTR